MTFTQVLFLIFAAIILGSAFMVVTTKKMIHAAFWLITTLFGVAALYAMLNAGFLAMVQIVVYVGAIAILFIFAIMLTRKDLRDSDTPLNKNWGVAALIGFLSFGGLLTILNNWTGLLKEAPELSSGMDTISDLGVALLSPNAYLLPFEVASVLLLAALIGSVYVANQAKSE
ncbi:MAG: NADH-quinone oxidoreductase subunit J [Anaerolineales bacterium]|uniref:NADH-quinone oxidoreductase subunit J n=1 Tax=Candidatus Desulfolinea nitratireducens TaxID=2841698 RepID=A0A8J6THK1_9CHLR|nr:NADH-quinone oxidoreductase subunit J [Candidatus Desulfolinea nitratireducens]MBL6960198.1 NADH-quinone oxidoreductase subunit J [Anaerolineales bacterium]